MIESLKYILPEKEIKILQSLDIIKHYNFIRAMARMLDRRDKEFNSLFKIIDLLNFGSHREDLRRLKYFEWNCSMSTFINATYQFYKLQSKSITKKQMREEYYIMTAIFYEMIEA